MQWRLRRNESSPRMTGRVHILRQGVNIQSAISSQAARIACPCALSHYPTHSSLSPSIHFRRICVCHHIVNAVYIYSCHRASNSQKFKMLPCGTLNALRPVPVQVIMKSKHVTCQLIITLRVKKLHYTVGYT